MSRLLLDGWHVVLGIETHAQIKSRQKLFSSAPTSLLAHTHNTNFNPFDAAFPGTLPRINPKCVLLALRASLALNCRVRERSTFDRKHYFYSDLPVGYQITQHYAPIAQDGHLILPTLGKKIRIQQVQMEQVCGLRLSSLLQPSSHSIGHCEINIRTKDEDVVHRPQPVWQWPLGNSHRTRLGIPGRGCRIRSRLAGCVTRRGRQRRKHGNRVSSLRCQRVHSPPRRAFRHPLRNQEPQQRSVHRRCY